MPKTEHDPGRLIAWSVWNQTVLICQREPIIIRSATAVQAAVAFVDRAFWSNPRDAIALRCDVMVRGTAAGRGEKCRTRRFRAHVHFDPFSLSLDELGACRVCGCTDDDACEGGCSWIPGQDLCSKCAPKPVRKKPAGKK